MAGPNNRFQVGRQVQIDCLLNRLINLFEAHGHDSIQVDQLVERPRFQADARAANIEMSELYSRAVMKWKLKQNAEIKTPTAERRLAELLG